MPNWVEHMGHRVTSASGCHRGRINSEAERFAGGRVCGGGGGGGDAGKGGESSTGAADLRGWVLIWSGVGELV